jgi:hypothetical protein
MPDPTHPNDPDQHPLAPENETPHERAENETEAVDVRAGVEVGPMRYVLWIGLALAIGGILAAYFFGFLSATPDATPPQTY